MINKQGLWFLTLFSLILVLSIYYITMPNEMFQTNNNANDAKTVTETENVTKVEEANYITVLKMELETERETELKNLEKIINQTESTAEEKSNAYEQIKSINTLKGSEETIEKNIKTNLKLSSFVKIKNNEISVVVDKKDHSTKIANEIMRIAQKEFTNPMSISVKFS